MLATPLEDAGGAVPVMAALAREGVAVIRFSYDQPTLDAVFFALTAQRVSPKENLK